jgi:hypothetical protein
VSGRGRLVALVGTALSTFGCDGGTKYIGSNAGSGAGSAECAAPVLPPAALGLDPFYARYTDARGVPVVSSASVSDSALAEACDISIHVLEKRAEVHARLVENGLRIVVIAESEVMTDIPEYRDIYSEAPGLDWDNVARSVGPFGDHPLASAAEENLLCLSDDLFVGETMLIHSLAHGLRRLGILDIEPGWDQRVRAAYDAALDAGLWTDTFAATNLEQYWAEGVQGFYDANREVASPDPDRLHNEINTRGELRAYDPALATIIAEYVPDDAWRPACAARP